MPKLSEDQKNAKALMIKHLQKSAGIKHDTDSKKSWPWNNIVKLGNCAYTSIIAVIYVKWRLDSPVLIIIYYSSDIKLIEEENIWEVLTLETFVRVLAPRLSYLILGFWWHPVLMKYICCKCIGSRIIQKIPLLTEVFFTFASLFQCS